MGAGDEKGVTMYGQQVTERYLGDRVVTVNCNEAALKRKQERDEVVTVQYVGVLFTIKYMRDVEVYNG